MPSYSAPGTRKGNRHWIIRGYVQATQYEVTAPKAKNKRDARAHWENFSAAIRRSDPVSEGLTFTDAVRHYEETGERSRAQSNFIKPLEAEIGDVLVDTISPGDVLALGRKLYPRARASTINRNVVSVVAAVINRSARDGRCRWFRAERLKAQAAVKLHPSPGAGEVLLGATEGYQRLLIAAYHYQGLRPSDALAITWEGIDLYERRFQIVVPKTGRLKSIEMDDAFFTLLANVPPEERHGPLFPWRSRDTIARWLGPLAERLGLRFSARMARHLFASDHAANGASELDLVELGSWTSTQSTKHYVTMRRERARALLQQRNVGKIKGKAG
jgi:integrase